MGAAQCGSTQNTKRGPTPCNEALTTPFGWSTQANTWPQNSLAQVVELITCTRSRLRAQRGHHKELWLVIQVLPFVENVFSTSCLEPFGGGKAITQDSHPQATRGASSTHAVVLRAVWTFVSTCWIICTCECTRAGSASCTAHRQLWHALSRRCISFLLVTFCPAQQQQLHECVKTPCATCCVVLLTLLTPTARRHLHDSHVKLTELRCAGRSLTARRRAVCGGLDRPDGHTHRHKLSLGKGAGITRCQREQAGKLAR